MEQSDYHADTAAETRDDNPSEFPDLTVSQEPDNEPGADTSSEVHDAQTAQAEIGGRSGPEPTRYGDWEKNGRCIDF
ncbi:MAG: DUF1674 domain-containing protein [bacterium]